MHLYLGDIDDTRCTTIEGVFSALLLRQAPLGLGCPLPQVAHLKPNTEHLRPLGPKGNGADCISVNWQVLVPFSYLQSKEKDMKIL